MKTALVIGATGMVGSACLHQLLADDYYDKVMALSRKPLGLDHPKLINPVVDFNNPSSYSGYCTADHVFSAIGTTIKKAGSQAAFYKVDFTYAYEVAIAAKTRGAQTHVLVSSIGASASSPVFYTKTKGQLEAAITALEFEHNIILRPSLLLGSRNEGRFGEKIAQLFSPIVKWVAPNYQGVEYATVAKAMILLAKTTTEHALVVENKTIIKLANE